MKKIVKLVAGAAAFGVLSSAVFQGTNYVTGYYGTTGQERTATQTTVNGDSLRTVSTNSGNEIAGVSGVAEAVLPSIVAIDVKVVNRQQDFFGRIYESEGTGSGSGIIIKEDSDFIYIVTNNHVVESSVQVAITFQDKSTADATVIGTDANSDLAVVKVAKSSMEQTALSNLKVAKLADSTQTKVGEQAIAIGNALGYGTSVTVGYVSALEREIEVGGGNESSGSHQSQTGTEKNTETMKLIQTDAAINPGNSGGALVNASGEVIGINSSKFASEEVEGMGFAIPISDAVPIIEKLMQGEQEQKGQPGQPGQAEKSSSDFS